MKIYSGKQKIGRVLDTDLIIDFDDLFKFEGNRYLKNKIEKQVSNTCFLVGIFLIAISLILSLLDGKLNSSDFTRPGSLIYLIPFFSIYFFLFGAYLRRNKDEFPFNLDKTNLKNAIRSIRHSEVKNLEIENFYSEEVLQIIDSSYFGNPKEFLFEVLDKLLEDSEINKIIVKRFGINPINFKKTALKYLKTKDLSFDENYSEFFLTTFHDAFVLNLVKVDSVIVFFTFLRTYIKDVLPIFELDNLEVSSVREWYKNSKLTKQYKKVWNNTVKLKPKGPINRAYTSRATHNLDLFGRDLTATIARRGPSLSLGKDEVMLRTLNSLRQENHSSVLILGEAGVGKTFFLSHLATKMVTEDVPKELQDKRLVVVDFGIAMAKFGSVDEFKNAFGKMLEEVVVSKNVVLVFEEVEELFTLREDIRSEVIDLLVEYIEVHKIKVLATSDSITYSAKIAMNHNFAAIFDVVKIEPMNDLLTLQVLIDLEGGFEQKYKVGTDVKTLKLMVGLLGKINTESAMPARAVDFLEEAFIYTKNKGLKYLDQGVLSELLSKEIGVNVGNLSGKENEKLKNLEELIGKRIVGQKEAVRAVANALRRQRAGLSSGKRPVASFLFYGPTGVGKTEVSKALAEVYYGDEKLMIRLDMSEFQEEKNLPKIIGEIDDNGNFTGGMLTDALRRNPFSVVLLDEIEKANPKVLDLFLQVLDEGHLTDGAGRKIDFTNSIIIATSNAGTKKIGELLTTKPIKEIELMAKEELKNIFRVEFLNRFDDLIMFTPLTQIEISQIADILLNKLRSEILEKKHIKLMWDNNTVQEIAKIGYSPIFGARELRRAVQDSVENEIAKAIIERNLKPGATIIFEGLTLK